ncbi:MAG: acyltransferase [Pseudomonadota bacterium]
MTTIQKPDFRLDIQGLRALAVVSVIIYHVDAGLVPRGYLGVDIFFVVSGYVITATLAKRHAAAFGDFLLSFAARRVSRLLPALVLCVAITALAGFAFLPPDSGYFEQSWKTGIAALVGLSNVQMYRASIDYFGTSADFNLFTQTWSLGVEEQFYLMFPVLLWVTGFAKKDPKGSRRLFITIAVLSCISFLLFSYMSTRNPSGAFYLVPARFWELGAGSMAFLARSRIVGTLGATLRASRTTALLLLVATLLVRTPYDVEITAMAVILTVMLLLAAHRDAWADKVLTSKLPVYFGTISYSLYLWHWSVFCISRWTVGVYWWTVPFQLLLIVVLSTLSYSHVEQPFRRRLATWEVPKTLALGLAMSMLGTLLIAILAIPLKGRSTRET